MSLRGRWWAYTKEISYSRLHDVNSYVAPHHWHVIPVSSLSWDHRRSGASAPPMELVHVWEWLLMATQLLEIITFAIISEAGQSEPGKKPHEGPTSLKLQQKNKFDKGFLF
ncbi:hypothetical protein ACFX13_029974 [Malus domestica]